MTWFWITLTALLFVFALGVHEAAHALVLRRLGVRIASAGLGMPLPPMLRITGRGERPTLTLSPWLVGAYVSPDARDAELIEAFDYRDTVWYAGAGIVSNLLMGEFLIGVVFATGGSLLGSLIAAGLLVLTWFGRRLLVSYVFPVLGVPLLGFLAYSLAVGFAHHDALGPAGVVELVGSAVSFRTAVLLGALINISLAIFNLTPIYPLDGGRIADAVLRRLWGARPAQLFRRVTGAVLACLFVFILGSDLIHITGV